jgi:hypothetical protein
MVIKPKRRNEMMTKVKGQNCLMVFLVCTVVLLLACGGGGSSGGTSIGPGSSKEPVDEKQVMGSTTAGRIVSTMVSQLSQNMSPIRSAQNSLNSVSLLGSISDKGACTVSGTNSVRMSWTGPEAQYISSCEDVSDLSATLILDKCIQSDKPQTEQSMELTLYKDGSLCKPSIINAQVRNLHVIDSSNNSLDFQSDALQIDITEITFSGDNSFITHANIALTGDARGTADNRQYAARFNNFIQIIDTEDNHSFTTTFSGQIQSDCMEQWAEITTITPIQFTGENCPTHGEIIISSGGESTTVSYQSDGSVTVGDTTYDSCQQLEEGCTDA